MAELPRTLVEDIRRLVNPLRLEEADGQLLDAFATSQDQDAFETLVRRHGPRVFAICRRVLGQASAADDAFQVTFLTLARKARTLRKQQAVGAWLYRVAHRVAYRARTREQRRRQAEAAMKQVQSTTASADAESMELLAALEAELAELPEKYRAPLLLCGVEEKTHEEAARMLGCPLGSMSKLLARGRALLRQCLARRGFTLGAGTLAALSRAEVQAMVPAALLQATVRDALPIVLQRTMAGATAHLSPNVAGLLKETLRAMLWTKGKLSVLVLILGLIFALVGVSLGPGKGEWPEDALPPEDAAQTRDEKLAGKEPRTDSYGDPLPPDALGRLGTVRFRHGTGISFLDFTADGKTIVYTGSGGIDNVVRVVDARTGKELRSFKLKPAEPLVEAIAPMGRPTLSPDGKMLAIAWSDGRPWNEPEKIKGVVIVWDTATGKELRRIDCAGIPGRPAFSPDSKLLLTVFKGRLYIWDAATGKNLYDFNEFAGQVWQPIFSADGKLLVLSSYLKIRPEPSAVLFCDPTTWRVRSTVPLKDFQNLHALSPDGKLLVGDDAMGHLYFWEAATGKLIERVLADTQASPSSITSVSFSPDSKLLAVVVRDGRVALWDVATRKMLHKVEGAYGAAVFAPRGEPLLATGSNGPALRFWAPSTAKEIPSNDAPSDWVQITFWLPGDKVLAVYPAEKGYRLWDWRSGKQLAKVTTGDRYIRWAVASPDGKFLAVSNWYWQAGDDKATHLFDLQTGKEIPRLGLKEFMGSIPIRFTSDGRFLIASEEVKGPKEQGVASRLVMWDTATGKVTLSPPELDLKKLKLKGGWNRSVISADGKSLVLAMTVDVPEPPDVEDRGWINQEYYWCSVDTTTGKLRWRTAQVKQTDALAISPDGKVVACGIPGKVQLRNGDTGALLHDLDCHTKYPRPWSIGQLLAFTSDGKRFLATDAGSNVFVWDVATGKELHKFAGHRGRILSISVSPDNTMFATASEDSTVMLWRMESQGKGRLGGVK